MEELHKRLREELDRLGLSMADAARAIGDDSSQGIRDVCSGRKRASAELVAKLSSTGVDVLYILTGNHSPLGELSADESALLNNFRAIPEERKFSLIDVASALAKAHGEKKKAG